MKGYDISKFKCYGFHNVFEPTNFERIIFLMTKVYELTRIFQASKLGV